MIVRPTDRRRRTGQCVWRWMVVALVACASLTHADERDSSLIIDHRCVDTDDRLIPLEWLDRARRLRVLLGHESVGWNVIGGLERLSRERPQRYRMEFGHQIQPAWYDRHTGLGDLFVRNMANVPGKARVFEQALRGGIGDRVEVASLKLCWADLQERNDPDASFRAYVDVMERMQQAYPRVRFVYWTMPLRREARLQEKRTRFNRLMEAYIREHSVPLFDIADLECHRPDGTEFRNETGELAMWDGYTNDGGHLNEVGAARAARAWWWLIARLAGWSGPQ